MNLVSHLMQFGRDVPTEHWTPAAFEFFKVLLQQAKYYDHYHNKNSAGGSEETLLIAEIEARITQIEDAITKPDNQDAS